MAEAVGMTIKIQGLDVLEKRLKELGARMSQNILRKALRAAMKPVVADAQERARAQLKKRMGILFKSIKAETGGKKGEAYIKLGFAKRAAYGIPLELGTSFFPPKPMLRPALDTKSEEAVAIFKARLGEEIDKAVKV